MKATFFFDLASPFTYLAAERVDRMFPGLTWRPALTEALLGGDPLATGAEREAAQDAAEQRAAQLHLPLVWPDDYPTGAPVAMRVASLAAAEGGHAAAFVLAASRLAFCGGFDLDDVETLAEAAAAACLSLDGCLDAVSDIRRDGVHEAAARGLLAAGASRLPAIRVGRTLLCGEDQIASAAALMHAPPLRPAARRRLA